MAFARDRFLPLKILPFFCWLLVSWFFSAGVDAARLKEFNSQKNVYVTEWSKLKHQAELGDPDALFALGNFYFEPPQGSSFRQNYKKAAELYFQASIRENPSAQYNVALMLYRGLGFKQNLIESYSWFYLASINPSPVARHINRKTETIVAQLKSEFSPEELQAAEERIANYQQLINAKRYRDAELPEQN